MNIFIMIQTVATLLVGFSSVPEEAKSVSPHEIPFSAPYVEILDSYTSEEACLNALTARAYTLSVNPSTKRISTKKRYK